MLTKERVFELMKEAGLDEQKFQALMEKENARLSPDELDEVTGGYFWQGSSSYRNFFARAGVTWEHNTWSSDTFTWNGKTYDSRSDLLKDLKEAGFEPKKHTTHTGGVYGRVTHTSYD